MKLILSMIKKVVLALLLAAAIITVLVAATIQTSFKNCPPTETELEEYPELQKYVKGQ